MISARVLQNKQVMEALGESTENFEMETAQAEKALNSIGVSIRDETGDLRALEDIMFDVAQEWGHLTDSSKQFISEKMAGNNRRSYVIGLLENYSRVIELQAIAEQSEGAMAEASEKQAKSVEGRLNALKTTVDDFYDHILNGDMLKSGISVLNSTLGAVVTVADALKGKLVPALGAVAGAMAVIKWNTIVDGFKTLHTAIYVVTDDAWKAVTAMGALNVALGAGIGVAVVLGVRYLANYQTSMEKTKKAMEEVKESSSSLRDMLKQDIGSTVDKYGTLVSQLQNMTKEMGDQAESSQRHKELSEQLAQVRNELSGIDSEFANILDDETLTYQEQLALLREMTKERLTASAITLETKWKDYMEDNLNGDDMQAKVDLLQIYADNYAQMKRAYNEAIASGETATYKGAEYTAQALERMMNNTETNYKKVYAVVRSYISDLDIMEKAEYNTSLSEIELSKALTDLFLEMTDVEEQADKTTQSIEALGATSEQLAKQQKEANEQYVESLSSMREIKALIEQINEEGMSLDNMSNVLSMFGNFSGNIQDSASVIGFLNDQLASMEQTAGEAYRNMMAYDNDFWEQKMKNSAEWADFEIESQNNVTKLGAEMLGIQEQDFIDFINAKGGFREVDLSNAQNLAQAEGTLNADLLNQVMKWYQDYVGEKGKARGVDMSNVIEFLNEQGVAEVTTINQLVQKWEAFYNKKKKAILDSVNALQTAMGGELNSLMSSSAGMYDKYDINNYSQETQSKYWAIQKEVQALKNATNAMTNYFANSKVSFDKVAGGLSQSNAGLDKLTKPKPGSGSGNKGSGSGSKDKDKNQEVADLDLKIDKFKEFEEAINRASEALQRNQEAQRMVKTKSELKTLLDDEIGLMEKKKEALGKLQSELKKEQQFLQSRLEISNLVFNKNGEIVGDKITGGSVTDRLKDAEKWSNSAKGKEKEWRINDTVNFKDTIDAYYDLMNQLGSVTSQYNDMIFEIEQTKKAHEELLKQIENLADRYYDLNDAIDDTTLALDRHRRKESELETVEQAIEYHEKEIKLIQEKMKAYENLLAEQNKAREESRQELSSKGIKFDDLGNIVNYKDKIKELQDYANTLAGTAQQAQIENIESLIEMIKEYTELTNNTIPNTEDAILDLKDEIKNSNKEFEEMIKVVDKLGEKYYRLGVMISKVDSALALNKTLQESTTGEKRVELLEEEIKLIREKQSLLMQQKEAYEKTASSLKEQLSQYGVEFKEDGTVANYDLLTEAYEKRANSLVGESRDKVLQEYQKLIELMKEYDEVTLDSIPNIIQQWQEYSNSIKDIERSKYETITEVEKKISSALENELTKRYNRIKESIQKQKDLYNKQYEQEDWDRKLASEQRKLDEIKQQMVDLSKDTSVSGQAKLEQLKQEYQQQLDAINDMIRENEKQLGNERFDEEVSKLDKELEDTLSPENLSQMVNQALVSGFAKVGDEVIELNTLMTNWLDKTGDGLYTIGNYLKNDLISSLQEAKALMQGIGVINNGISNKPLSSILNTDVSGMKGTSIEFNAPLVEIQGDVTEDLMPQIQAMIQKAQNDTIVKIERVLNRK